MNPQRFITAIACILLCGHALAQNQSMDKELSDLTEKLAAQIKDHGKKKVTVLDFTDLQGGSSELGKYIAEQLTVNFVITKHDFSVLDRANLKSILAEHKLTATGLVDPENAKKLGMFAGVDALILGTILPINQNIELTAKVITTDTAEIVGAAKSRFKSDDMVQQLLSHPTTGAKAQDNAGDEKTDDIAVVKSLGDVRVELQPLHVVNGNQYLLTMAVTNRNAKKSVWVALNTGGGFPAGLKAVVTDTDGAEFLPEMNSVSGIAVAGFQDGYMFPATEIKPGDSISSSIKFFSRDRKKPASGSCRLQLEFVFGHDISNYRGTTKLQNLVTKIEAN